VLERGTRRHQVTVEWKEHFISYIICTSAEYIFSKQNGVLGRPRDATLMGFNKLCIQNFRRYASMDATTCKAVHKYG